MNLRQLNRALPLVLAALLQTMPLLRLAVPAGQAAASLWAYVAPWVAGGVALMGYDAISSASSIAISPPTATNGVFYSGTITYSGSHAGSVVSTSLSNNIYSGSSWACLSSGSATLCPGLTVTYSGGNVAYVSGTPSVTLSTTYTNIPFRLIAYSESGCSKSGEYDARETTSLLVENSGGGQSAPTIAVQPPNVVGQVGSTVETSGGAVGNPTPKYYWKQGINAIPGANSNVLVLANIQLTNAGVYTMEATNSQGSTPAACYVSVCETPGSGQLILDYTNYLPAGTAVTMTSWLTNVLTSTTTYQWEFNFSSSGYPTTPTYSMTAAQVTPSKSGTYSIIFNSTVGSTVLVTNQEYDSYWSFGYPPVLTNSLPANTNVNAGANLTLTLPVGGSLGVYYASVTAITNSQASVFWMQGTNLVAAQVYTNVPTSSATFSNTFINASLTVGNVASANAGTYVAIVTNYWGSVTSAPVVVTVSQPPVVSAPVGATNYAGNPVSLAVTASGAAPLAYQWWKGQTALANNARITGANTNILSIAPTAAADSGSYSVVVTNSSGSATSTVATVSIQGAPSVRFSLSGTQPTMTATGIPYRTFVIETSTNLALPSAWVMLATNSANSSGVMSFTDTNDGTSTLRFYQWLFP